MPSIAEGSLLSTIGMAAVDAGLQLAQMGTLSDPFALPTHEAYYITLQAWAVDPATGLRKIPLMTHTFPVMPASLDILKQYLATVVSTPGGAYVDDFALPDPTVLVPYPITITGNFGSKARIFISGSGITNFDGGVGQLASLVPGISPSLGVDLVTGYGQNKFLERLCDLSHLSLTSAPVLQALQGMNSTSAAALGRATTLNAIRTLATMDSKSQAVDIPVEVVLYNWVFHQFVVVVINRVRFTRNATLNCWTYALQMTALRNAIQSPSDTTEAGASLIRSMLQRVANVGFDTVLGCINMPNTHTRP